jgi:hypothetical protein
LFEILAVLTELQSKRFGTVSKRLILQWSGSVRRFQPLLRQEHEQAMRAARVRP